MTAGGGIAHSEQSPEPHAPMLHGAQLWVALPDAQRERAPPFDHHRELPVLREPGATATVLLGELGGARSPGTVHTPLVGVDVTMASGADAVLPLEADFEHAVLAVSGAADVDGVPLAAGSMLYLGSGRSTLRLPRGDPEPAAAARREPVRGEDRDVVELRRRGRVRRSPRRGSAGRRSWRASPPRRPRPARGRSGPDRSAPYPDTRARRSRHRRCHPRRCVRAAAPVNRR